MLYYGYKTTLIRFFVVSYSRQGTQEEIKIRSNLYGVAYLGNKLYVVDEDSSNIQVRLNHHFADNIVLQKAASDFVCHCYIR